MMTLAFGESLAILGMLGIVVVILAVCAAVMSYAVRRFKREGKLSPILITLAALATLPPSALIALVLTAPDIKINPHIKSTDELYGVYSHGISVLNLNNDGTYSASGISGITSGTWSHYDWNLTLSNTQLEQPRIITRDGVLCVAPFFKSEGPNGILLIKQDASDGH